jgi:glutamate/tyrosine decarboxylase-like PLP-dependent enzyme
LEGLRRFDEELPVHGRSAAETLSLLHTAGSPATTATAGGRFYGLVVGGALPATVAASWLAAAWDQVVFTEDTSPVGIALERVTTNWLLDVFGLPASSYVGFVTGATMANVTCLAAARSALLRRRGHDPDADGLIGAPPVRVIVSAEIHVTVLKALSLLGLGAARVERVSTDEQGRMRPSALPPLDDSCLVICQAGNVNSGAFDPFAEICAAAEEAGAWVHVDGAFGLWALAAPSRRHLAAGIEHADSWATDTHKWPNTPYDCGLAICRHPDALNQAMRVQAPYLRAGAVTAPKDMVPEFSRRARAVEVWAALRTLGREGLGELVERCCRHAQTLAAGLHELGYDVLNDVVLNEVVAATGTPAQIDAIAARVQASGECWFGPTTWRDRRALRLSISSWNTTDDDIQRTLAAIRDATTAVL